MIDRKYKTIVVDPPWHYPVASKPTMISKVKGGIKKEEKFFNSITSLYEGTMTVDEIKEFDLVQKISDDECIIFLWTTNKYLFECPSILERWGFDLGDGGRTMCWNKIGAAARSPMNWESNGEYIVVGKKGHPEWRTTKGLQAVFNAPNEGHSIKPALFYRMIRNSTHSPRVDIFARRRHDGFDAWGNQVELRENDLITRHPEQRIIQIGSGELHIDIDTQ